jgi:hypothetical protein
MISDYFAAIRKLIYLATQNNRKEVDSAFTELGFDDLPVID